MLVGRGSTSLVRDAVFGDDSFERTAVHRYRTLKETVCWLWARGQAAVMEARRVNLTDWNLWKGFRGAWEALCG